MFLEAEIKRELSFLNSEEEREAYLSKALFMAEMSEDKAQIKALSKVIMGEAEEENFSTSLRAKVLRYHILHSIQTLQEGGEDEALDEVGQSLYEALWELKWVAEDYAKTLDFSEEEIASHISFMGDIYEGFQFNLAPVYKAIMQISIDMGEKERAIGAYDRWQEEKNKEEGYNINDCEACEVTDMVKYHNFIGDWERAISLAEPILSGELTCAEVPELTYAPVLESLISLGKREKAKELFDEAIARVLEHDNQVEFLPKLIEVAYLLDEKASAKALSDLIKEKTTTKLDAFYQLGYYMATFWQDEAHYSKAEALAKAFDERNGNTYYQKRLQALKEQN